MSPSTKELGELFQVSATMDHHRKLTLLEIIMEVENHHLHGHPKKRGPFALPRA